MKVALCCIGKNENRYIREYVDHYRTIGVDKIFLFDNNDPDGEKFEEVIQPEIDSGFVEITDYRGEKVCQLRAYQECYDKHGGEYDWICFFDCDEFWDSNYFKNIKVFLGQKKFEPFDMIHINCLIYGDNEKLFYEDIKMSSRFPNDIGLVKATYVEEDIPESYHIKSIIRGGRTVLWLNNPHTPINKLICSDNKGNKIPSESPFVTNISNDAWLNHYWSKSTEEFIDKITRGYPDHLQQNKEVFEHIEGQYFRINKRTPEKIKVFENKLGISLFKQEYIDKAKFLFFPYTDLNIYRDFLSTHDNIVLKYEDIRNNVYRIHLGRQLKICNKDDTYVDLPLNYHHCTTNYLFTNVLPKIFRFLNINLTLKDFKKIKNQKEGFDFSFYAPLNYGQNTTQYAISFVDFENNEPLKKIMSYEDMVNNEDIPNKFYCLKELVLSGYMQYHSLYIGAHQPSKIENYGDNNGKTLFISHDSMMLPLIPLLGSIYKKVIAIDNRFKVNCSWMWINESIDDVLFCPTPHNHYNLFLRDNIL